jgi:UDP-N-acetylmuramoyl-tripeptide--D-alanyl-D-alanine ligase
MTIDALYQHFLSSYSVCTDTRKIKKGDLFFALKGENFNGNLFAKSALDAGASHVVIDEKEHAPNANFTLVDDVLTCLQALATHHRKQFKIPFLAITGSNGKTTTKELVGAVLKQKYTTHITTGNLNNHIGVPLTLLSMPLNTEIAVIEMGANHQKEIAQLCQLALPTHGLITNIGKAHLEGFGGPEGVLKGKTELFDFLQNAGNTILFNDNSVPLAGVKTKYNPNICYSLTDKNAFMYAEIISAQPYIKFNFKGSIQDTALIGDYNFENILAAMAVGKLFNVPEELFLAAIGNYSPTNNRSQVIEKGHFQLVMDAYNANPSSMQSAINNLAELAHTKKIVILGDMFELGDTSEKEHLFIYELAESKAFWKCFFVGKHFKNALPNAKNVYAEKAELTTLLSALDLDKSLVLIKGSRGMGLETLLDSLK